MATGSCVCKRVTYAFTGEPALKALCHCRECQKLSGSAFTYNFVVPRENFQWTSGETKYNSFVQESGAEFSYRFCPNCSTVLIKECEADMFKTVYMIQSGTLDGDVLVKEKPDVEFWTTRKAGWHQAIDGVAQKTEF